MRGIILIPDCCHGHKRPPYSVHDTFVKRMFEMFIIVARFLERKQTLLKKIYLFLYVR